MEGLGRDRDQLWAEAAQVEAQHGFIGLPENLWGVAADLQASRVDADPWDDILWNVTGRVFMGKSGQPEERIATRDLLELKLNVASDRMGDTISKRLAFVMRRLGWQGPVKMREGEVVRGYFRETSWNRWDEQERKK